MADYICTSPTAVSIDYNLLRVKTKSFFYVLYDLIMYFARICQRDKMSVRISKHNRVVYAVCKEVVTQHTRIGVYQAVRRNPPPDCRIIVPALAVIQLGLGVEAVATVAQGVDVRQVAGGGDQLTPGVVGVTV